MRKGIGFVVRSVRARGCHCANYYKRTDELMTRICRLFNRKEVVIDCSLLRSRDMCCNGPPPLMRLHRYLSMFGVMEFSPSVGSLPIICILVPCCIYSLLLTVKRGRLFYNLLRNMAGLRGVYNEY